MSNENPDDELARLREHNARLLDELKQAKAQAKTAKADADTLRGQLEATQGQLNTMRLDGPVSDMLARVALPGAVDAVRALMQARGLTFALDDKGQPVPMENGKPATLPKDGAAQPVAFDAAALADWLCPKDAKPDDARRAFAPLLRGTHASGGGARGGGEHTPTPQQPEAKPQARPAFGLG